MIKSLFYKRGITEVLFLWIFICLALYPLESQANLFSYVLSAKTKTAYAQSLPLAKNSQTLALLEAKHGSTTEKQAAVKDVVISDETALVPMAGPSGTIADVSDDTTSGQISTYVVRSGDSLSIIADMFGVSVNTIIWANDLKKGQALDIGTTLIILPVSGVKYTVKKGDTAGSIAKKFGVDFNNDIIAYNNLENTSVNPGDVLIIPGAELAPENPPVVSKSHTKLGGSSSIFAKIQAAGSKIAGYYMKPIPCPLTQGRHDTYAVDIGCGGSGMAVKAAATGTVKFAKLGWNGGFGNLIVLAHPNGTQTFYAHLSKINVGIGSAVSQGSVIGNVGATGHVTGPHLHFEVRGAYNPGFDSSGSLWKH